MRVLASLRSCCLVLLFVWGTHFPALAVTDVFPNETWGFAESPGGYYSPAQTRTMSGLGYSGAGTVRLGVQWYTSGGATIGAVEDHGVFAIVASGSTPIDVPQFDSPYSNSTHYSLKWKREAPFFQASWNNLLSITAASVGSGVSASNTSTILIKIKNESDADVTFTWAMNVETVTESAWLNGTKFTGTGYVGGSTVIDLEPGQTVTLNSGSPVAYQIQHSPEEGTGNTEITMEGELTLLLGSPWDITLEYDLTRVFDSTVTAGTGGLTTDSDYTNGAYDVTIAIVDVPAASTLTLAYQIRNSTPHAQPIKVEVQESSPGADDGGIVAFGNASVTASGATPTALSQIETILESELSGRAWSLKVGSETVKTGTFPEDGPFTISFSGEVGGLEGGYAFVDGAWVPRGGGSKPLLDDPTTEEPDEAEAAEEGLQPGDNEVVAGRATRAGVEAALGGGTVDSPDLGKVTDQKKIAAYESGVTVTSGASTGSLGSGSSSGFTFSFLGHTFAFDLNFHESIGGYWIPTIRGLIEWFLYVCAAMGAWKILATLKFV